MEPRILPSVVEDKQKVFELKVKKAVGKMVVIGNDYVVVKGSTAVIENRQSCPDAIIKLRDKLKDNGVIVDNGNGVYTFIENVKFNSPSYAAAAIVGGSANGRKQWKFGNKTLNQIEQELENQG